MTGKLKDLTFTRTGEQIISIAVKSDVSELFDELKDCDVDIEIERYRDKRSLSANNYCWTLCGKIADKLADDDIRNNKDSVYREAIRQIGIYKDFHDLDPEEAKTLRIAWKSIGTGWITEQVDYSQDGDKVTIRCYYGSSQYNTKQMSRLIDNLKQDCEALGIPTETPEETAKRLSLWEEGAKERQKRFTL